MANWIRMTDTRNDLLMMPFRVIKLINWIKTNYMRFKAPSLNHQNFLFSVVIDRILKTSTFFNFFFVNFSIQTQCGCLNDSFVFLATTLENKKRILTCPRYQCIQRFHSKAEKPIALRLVGGLFSWFMNSVFFLSRTCTSVPFVKNTIGKM